MNTNQQFKLRQCIDAHDNDVKCIFALPHRNMFLSASRDLSVQLWNESDEKQYNRERQYIFHDRFLAAVVYKNPSDNCSEGVIFSAGYDKVIHGYGPTSSAVQFSLVGHTDTVTSLACNGDQLVSGSMDRSAILWDLRSNTVAATFTGHSHGIWSVALLKSVKDGLLTASADKQVFLWNTVTKAITKQFTGHTDCVRIIAELPELSQFLSAGNDCTIRLWSLINGACLNVFHGHSSTIYSLAIIPGSSRFVSTGEDKVLCIWNLNEINWPTQTIAHDAESVWCVSVLSNGDIATGSSDGRIRLFSQDPQLQNGVEYVKEKTVNATDDSAIEMLPAVGIECLCFPGDHQGALMKVNDEGTNVVYQWSVTKNVWTQIKVLDKAVSAEKKTGDYVFSIDIKDGEPPLSLAYNINQDPYLVAQTFLADNSLSPMFMDQVVAFIKSNTPQDVPTPSGNPDPLTRTVPVNPMFPQTTYTKFDQINAVGLSKKLVEFAAPNVVPKEILCLVENIQQSSAADAIQLTYWIIGQISECAIEHLFPLVDLLRMLVQETKCNEIVFHTEEKLAGLLSMTLQLSDHCSKPNAQTMIKLMVNAFCHMSGRNLMNDLIVELADLFVQIATTYADKNILNAISAWFMNAGVAINSNYNENERFKILDACFALLDKAPSKDCSEYVLRILMSIGTLVTNNDSFSFRGNMTMGALECIKKVTKKYNDRALWGEDIYQCCAQLSQLVNSLDLYQR